MKYKKGLVLVVILVLIFCFISNMTKEAKSVSEKHVETTSKTAEVQNQTIITTLTAPGEVKSAKTEKLSLDTSKNYLTMCAESNEKVKSGGNLLKYTDGTFLTAPYDCVILEYSVPIAKEECTEKHYISVSSVESLYMDINISEEQLSKVSVGQDVEIVSNYDESKVYTGTISKINAIGTKSSSGTKFAAIASIQNDGNLKLGMSATCTVVIEKNENVPCLPIESIQIENKEKYVNLLKEDGSKEKVKVETGKADSNNVQILSGVSLEDKVEYETQTITVTSVEETASNALTQIFSGGKGNSRPNMSRGGF